LLNYQRTLTDVAPSLDRLRRATADNDEQQRLSSLLKPAIESLFSKMASLINIRRTQNMEAALTAFESGTGPSELQAIRDRIIQMTALEDTLYASRIIRVQQATLSAVTAAVLALTLFFAALAVWIWNARQATREMVVMTAERDEKETRIRHLQKMEAVGQLTGGLAHDLNNMLAVIISGLTLTQKRLAAGDANVSRFIDGAMDGAARAASLTTRLMAFSRQLPLKPETIDANRLVSGMSDLLQRALGETVKTQTVLSAGLWHANADAGELENAILNLAINSRDAMAGGGNLTIETSNCHFDADYAKQNDMPEGDYILISVSDSGTGMSADVISKAFDPFFTTKGVGKGTGLGLSQVFGFIKQTGGHIKIYSELGHGTTIKMYLPRQYDTGPDEKVNSAKQEAWPISASLRKDNAAHLILVVEDDSRVREMTVSVLRELGYTVIHADGAENALEKLEGHPKIELLFTDIVMPGINGRQLAAEVLRRKTDIKVLYTTGFTRNAIVHNGKLDAGLNFIAKPFTLAQLESKLRNVLYQIGDSYI
jgi:signal transduction histidine kinase/ActR/RegA family two-component response regulator